MTPEPGDDARVHRAPYRVRLDEAGPRGLLRASGLLRFAQDVAWQHSEALGFDRAWYRERDLAWLVRAAEVEALEPIPMGALLDVSTRVLGYRKVWARRRAEVRLDGSLVAAITTDWLLVDGRGRPARVPDLITARLPGTLTAERLGRVDLAEPGPGAVRRRFAVRPQELDPMDHVNNAVFVDWLEESVESALGGPGTSEAAGVQVSLDALPRRYRLEYAAAAEPGWELEAVTWWDDDGWAFRVRHDVNDVLRARLNAPMTPPPSRPA